jgi:hypothetical protein
MTKLSAAPGKVYVMGDSANFVAYLITDPSDIVLNGLVPCSYSRVG